MFKYQQESKEGAIVNQELYKNEESNIARIFMWLELAPLIELMHHLVGIQKLKSHVLIGMLINLWILFGVIAYNKSVRIQRVIRILNRTSL